VLPLPGPCQPRVAAPAGEQPRPIREIAWKAQLRLCVRYRKLDRSGKPANVVTAAIARELAGFICHRSTPTAGGRLIGTNPCHIQGGASKPLDMLLPGKAGGTAAVRRTLAPTICRIADPTLVARPRQLRDASIVMRFRPAHQSMINRRHDGRASCPAQQSLMPLFPMEPRIYTPATWKGGNECG
jgi:hypothetical protein